MCFSEVSGNQDRWFDQREREEKKKQTWIWFKRQKPGAKERADKKISDKKQSRALDGENVDHTDTK